MPNTDTNQGGDHADETARLLLDSGLTNLPSKRTETQTKTVAKWLSTIVPIDAEHLIPVVQKSTGVFCREGQTIYRVNESCEHFFVVVYGCVDITDIRDRDFETRDPVQRKLTGGMCTGEEEIMAGCRMPYSATATEEGTLLLKIPAAVYLETIMPVQEAAFEDKVKFLAMLAPLRALKYHVVKRLAPCFLPKEFKQRQILVRQGERADSMFAIKQGKCVVIVDPDLKPEEPSAKKKQERVLGDLDPKKTIQVCTLDSGAIIGDITVLSTVRNRTASVIAGTDVLCFRIRRAAFLRHLPSEELETLRRLATEKLHLTDDKVSRRMGLGALHEEILRGHNLRSLMQQQKEEKQRKKLKNAEKKKMRRSTTNSLDVVIKEPTEAVSGISGRRMASSQSTKRRQHILHVAALAAAGLEEDTGSALPGGIHVTFNKPSAQPNVPMLNLGLVVEGALMNRQPDPQKAPSSPQRASPQQASNLGSSPNVTFPATYLARRAATTRNSNRSTELSKSAGALTLSPFSQMTVTSKPASHRPSTASASPVHGLYGGPRPRGSPSQAAVGSEPLSLASNHGSKGLRESFARVGSDVTEAKLHFKSEASQIDTVWPETYLPPAPPAQPHSATRAKTYSTSYSLHGIHPQMIRNAAPAPSAQDQPPLSAEPSSPWQIDSPRYSLRAATEDKPPAEQIDTNRDEEDDDALPPPPAPYTIHSSSPATGALGTAAYASLPGPSSPLRSSSPNRVEHKSPSGSQMVYSSRKGLPRPATSTGAANRRAGQGRFAFFYEHTPTLQHTDSMKQNRPATAGANASQANNLIPHWNSRALLCKTQST